MAVTRCSWATEHNNAQSTAVKDEAITHSGESFEALKAWIIESKKRLSGRSNTWDGGDA